MSWEELSSVYEQLHQCAVQIEDIARAKERQRIARDLHDSLGQTLTALNIQLQTALKLWRLDPEAAKSFLTQAQRLGANAIKEVRQSVCLLRATENADKPLEQLIESLVEDFQQVTGLSISTCINLSTALPQEVSTTVYRIVQEALNNICKHAAATAVKIQIKTIPSAVQLIVADNGKGFRRNALPKGFGLKGMAERVAALSGQFHIESEPGKGCQVKVELPIQQEATLEKSPIKVANNNVAHNNVAHNNVAHNNVAHNNVAHNNNVSVLTAAPPTATLVRCYDEQSSKLNPPPNQLETNREHYLSNSSYQIIDESFLRQCEQQLMDLVGPFAPFLMKETLKSSPGISQQELVENIAAKIPDPQVAAEFRQALSSHFHVETEPRKSRQFRVELPFQQKQSLDNIAADILALTGTQSTGGLVLCYEQSSWLEQILADYIGPLASSLLQQVTQQVLSCKELVARLLSHIPPAQQTEFEERVTLVFNTTLRQVGTTKGHLSQSSYQIIDESFLRHCKQQLTDLVGPFASFLMKETLKSSPGISQLELVEKIAKKIPDAQVAVEFQQRMYLWSRNKSLS
ncbi:sensor histidine kinase [Tolypothrix campylonemoides VB511288]|nr:sensor histidine kinase [Tolypothrix campylonemoides VB511288]